MGKQAYDKRAALANALNTGGAAVVPPPKKEEPKPAPTPSGKGKGKRRNEPAAPEKTRQEFEEERQQFVQDNERKRAEFFEAEAAKKMQEKKGADDAVTYIEDKDTRKPKAVQDISDYWKADLGMLPFMPGDNVGPVEADEDLDPEDRLEYLQMFNEQLGRLLRLKFNVFWSQMIYDDKVRRCLDSYLRFCLRSHDVSNDQGSNGMNGGGLSATEEHQVHREISRRVFAVFVRLSRPEESPTDFMSDGKFANVIYEHSLFDVPKLIDLCAIYGDSNRIAVTKIVHGVFMHQPLYTDDFKAVVRHMLDGLRKCCLPLLGLGESSDLDVGECIAFLPDILSCFNAIFCFFPEACVEAVVGGELEGVAGSAEGAAAIPLADLMVVLHDGLLAMQARNGTQQDATLDTIVTLLCRLLGLVLGFRMAPRRGAHAFQDLIDWLRAQADHADRNALLMDLGRHGLENAAMEWLASGLVDDAQLDYLEQLCGPVLPQGERRRRRATAPPAAALNRAGSSGAGGATSSSAGKPAGADASATDVAKIKEIREVVGMQFGEGFVLQCLMHFGGSVPAVVGAIFDGNLPPQISALPQGLSLADAISKVAEQGKDASNGAAPARTGLSAEDKRLVLGQAGRMQEETGTEPRARPGLLDDPYDDDVDDSLPMPTGFRVGGAQGSDSEEDGRQGARQDGQEEDGDSDEGGDDRWGSGKGGKGKGKGKGKGGKGPVQGQTHGARRKEENKARVGNHNRREGAMRKMMKASGGAVM